MDHLSRRHCRIQNLLMLLTLILTLTAQQYTHAHDGSDHVAEDEKAAALAQDYAPFEVDPATIAVPAQEDFDLLGAWSPVIEWPHIPVSAANLPDGRILTWASNQTTAFPGGTEFTYATVWDPEDNSFIEVNHPDHDMFCSHQVVLEDGRIFVAGGRNHVQTTSVFDAATNSWTMIEPMNRGRWYPTSVYQPDGSVFIAIGSSGGQYPEVWKDQEGWRLLTGIDFSDPILNYNNHYEQNWWPYLGVMPDGDVLHYGPTPVMHRLNSDGDGSIAPAGIVTNDWYPKHGGAVIYDEGKIIVAGGAKSGTDLSSTNQALIIDTNGTDPVVSPIAAMTHARKFHNAIMLANGEVIMIGGNTSGQKFNDSGTVLPAEIWNPTTGLWRETAPMLVPRNYHSIALLLVDGRVLSGGGGLCGGCAANHQDVQVYSPPYLFNDDGSLATRPVISSAPDAVNNGWSYPLQATAGASKFTMIKMSSTTHAVNTDQRFVNVDFAEASPGQYQLTFHANENVLTPGYYMLFAIAADGVPSIAEVVQVNAGVSPTNYPPRIAMQDIIVGQGDPLDVTPSASDIDGDMLSFSSTNLPAGLVIDSTTGRISGQTNAFGSFLVTLEVSDGKGGTGSSSFNLDVILPGGGSGKIDAEYWFDISGNNLDTLLADSAYPEQPDATDLLTRFETPTNWNNNYGTRVRGYLHPPVSGNYIFWIATDDQGELWLSSDEDEANKTLIANVPGWASSRQWNKFAEQQSRTISLEAGKRYYIEALQKEGGGGDNLAVAWQGPDGSGQSVILGEYLSEYSGAANQPPEAQTPALQVSTAGLAAQLSIIANDPDGDTLNYAANGLPPGLGIDNMTGTISGTPTSLGQFDPVVTINDGQGGEVLISFTWQVQAPAPVNRAPVLASPSDQLTVIGTAIDLLIDASDADNDALTFTAAGLPPGLVIDSSNGQISGSPDTLGLFSVEITVSDTSEASDTATIAWQIDDVQNHPPQVSALPNQQHSLNQSASLSVVANDADGDALTYSATGLPQGLAIDAADGLISGTIASLPGLYPVIVTVSDGQLSTTISLEWAVSDPSSDTGLFQTRVSNVGSDWQTVTLPASYTSMVVIATPMYQTSDAPAVARIRNAAGNRFEVKVQNPSGLPLSGYEVHITVAEEGVYTITEHGIKMEVVKVESTVTDTTSSWQGQAQSYLQPYTQPVVLGQVMSSHDSRWTMFWARGNSRANPPSASSLYVGKHTAQDSDTNRVDETLGYIVVEAGTYTSNGLRLTAALGTDTIAGADNSIQQYAFSQPLQATTVTLSSAAMDGTDGGWPILVDDSQLANGMFSLMVDEDQIRDGERSHTSEQIAYLLGAPGYVPVIEPIADQSAQYGMSITLQANGAHPLGSPLIWSAEGLPEGISIDPDSGLISGQVQESGIATVVLTASDTQGSSSSESFDWRIINPSSDLEKITHGQLNNVGSTWQTISLTQSYRDMLVIATPAYDASSAPAVTRVRNASGAGFELKVQNPSGKSLSGYRVNYLVVETGLYDETVHGFDGEAIKTTVSSADNNASWQGHARAYLNEYSTPVVVGQVMSNNDNRWSTFWSRGAGAGDPASASALHIGYHVAEDSERNRESELLGYLVMESGRGTLGDLTWQAQIGSNAIEGISASTAPFAYDIDAPFATAVLSSSGMNGGNGGWPVLSNLTDSSLQLAIDEDQIKDSERNHIDEQVAWLAFGQRFESRPALVGETVAFVAPVNGDTGSTYRWNFGDGSSATTDSSSLTASHSYAAPGRYIVTLTINNGSGTELIHYVQAVHQTLLSTKPKESSSIVITDNAGFEEVWVTNPDNNTVTVIDSDTQNVVTEIAVAEEPRSLAVDEINRVVVVAAKDAGQLDLIDMSSYEVIASVALPVHSKPHGVIVDESNYYVALQASGDLLRIDAQSLGETGRLQLGQNIRHLSLESGSKTLLASRFISPPVMNESSANPLTEFAGIKFGGEVYAVDTSDFSLEKTIVLQHSNLPDAANAGNGIPNYLGAASISPDGLTAWVPSKQDNIKRGLLRSGEALDHDNTVRSITSRISLDSLSEELSARIDHDDAGIANAATFGPNGNYLYVTLEGSRDIAMLDVFSGSEVVRINTGRAPHGVVVSDDGLTLYSHNFMDRTITIHDLRPVVERNEGMVPLIATLDTVQSELLTPDVLLGKQLFYDAADPRLALQRYISCASCHNDGAQDGRVWDLTSMGEGLRNTISLEGRAGTGHGPLHWSANFDEVQDFEGQIRALSSGFGLMDDLDFHAGTRSQPLGDSKAGYSGELDALAAYVESLSDIPKSPFRNQDDSLSNNALIGEQVFVSKGCDSCHSGSIFTDSAPGIMHDIGTIKTGSGSRLGAALMALDTPTLLGVWDTAPYLHDGSADTISDAIEAHANNGLTPDERDYLVEYLQQLQ